MSAEERGPGKRPVKYMDEIIVCDFCQNPSCPWKEYTISRPPKHCPQERVFYLSEPGEDVRNPEARTRVAELVGVFSPQKKAWVFYAPVALSLLPNELMAVIEKLNSFSSLNNLRLSPEIEYLERMNFQTFTEEALH